MADELTLLGQHVGCRDREVEGQLCRDVGVGLATDAVRAEESSHEVAFRWASSNDDGGPEGARTAVVVVLVELWVLGRGLLAQAPISACCTGEPCGPS